MKLRNEINRVKKFVKSGAWYAVVLAFLSGIVSLFTVVETYAKIATVIAVALAFISGFVGLLVMAATKRQETLEESFKKTKPAVDAYVSRAEEDGKLYVFIDSLNEVPFEYKYEIVTKNGVQASGIWLSWIKVVPNANRTDFYREAQFDEGRVIDDYIELHFHYRSPHAADFPEEDLSGTLIKRYHLLSV